MTLDCNVNIAFASLFRESFRQPSLRIRTLKPHCSNFGALIIKEATGFLLAFGQLFDYYSLG